MQDTSNIYEFQFHNPQKNFSGNQTRKYPEAKFAEQFMRAYQEKFRQIHSGTSKPQTLFIREIPISGNGIADLLVFSWSDSQASQVSTCLDLKQLNPTIRAFEFKLTDWRRGLMQAHRYKYFSHASILVLPKHKLKIAAPQIDLFRTLRVGLWGFETEADSIACIYTPRPKQQQIPKYRQKAIELAAQAVCS